MVTDPVADVLTRIRNAQTAHHRSVLVRLTTLTKGILEVLKKEGFIEGFSEKADALKGELKFGAYEVVLRYYETGDPVISSVERVSSPGRRLFSAVDKLPKVKSGLGISIVSTSKGVMSDRDARKQGVGGEVLARVG